MQDFVQKLVEVHHNRSHAVVLCILNFNGIFILFISLEKKVQDCTSGMAVQQQFIPHP